MAMLLPDGEIATSLIAGNSPYASSGGGAADWAEFQQDTTPI